MMPGGGKEQRRVKNRERERYMCVMKTSFNQYFCEWWLEPWTAESGADLGLVSVGARLPLGVPWWEGLS